jgi:hypothetical protein
MIKNLKNKLTPANHHVFSNLVSVLNIYHSQARFTPRVSRDVFIPFNGLFIWGLKND